MNLERFLIGLTKLKRGSTPYGLAPHKPILLLTLLDLLDMGYGADNKFYIDNILVCTFHENWDILASDGFIEDFTLPFYHLQNDKIEGASFWFLKTIPGHQITKHIQSIQTLSEMVEYACLSEPFFQMLILKENRDSMRNMLVKFYFPSSSEHYFRANREQGKYLKEVQQYVLNEVPKVMRLQVAEEEVVYVRNWTFKKLVPKVYQSTCAISGMKVGSINGRSLIDACHIVPFSQDQDDRISNGIALCPNLHRAFDSGLVSIDQDYRVLVSDQVIEDRSHPYGLADLKGRKVILPKEKKIWPSQRNLERHRSMSFLN
ncbi:HNH endonuclease [Algoriphagus machipongonensis]|uniref:HNH endonuclease family protein n=1 Tax=Algoriphagus machipongonensis TaxID=388413 RepID=A3HSL8_9BACT|nr:HNH endonuclease [Algoriphagus machipongonensis]EAZ82836.1 putative HNH endonuclease family protein [Algoriphagus machipongonensis]